MKNIILRVYLLILFSWTVIVNGNCQEPKYGEALLDSLDNLNKYPGDKEMLKIINGAIPRIKEENDLKSYYTCILTLSSIYYNLDKHNLWGKYINLAHKLSKDSLNFPQEYMGSILNNLAVYQNSKGNHKQAVATYLKSIEEEKRTNNDEYEISIIYDNINSAYSTLGDFKKAIEYSKRSYQLKKNSTSKYFKNNPNYRHYQMSISLYNVGKAQQKMNDFKNAEQNLIRSLEELYKYKPKTITKKHKKLINTYHKLAEIYYQNKNPRLMLEKLNQANDIQKTTDYRKYKNFELFGNYHALTGDFDKAEKYLSEALVLSKERYKLTQDLRIPAKTLNLLGDVKLLNKKYDEALRHYHEGLQYIDHQLDHNLSKSPSIDNIQATSQALELLKKKAHSAYMIYNKDKETNVEYLEKSYNSYLVVAQLLDQMRRSFLSETSKFYAAESAIPIYQEGMKIMFEYFNTKRTAEVIDQIFEYMEFNKNCILFESIQNKFSLAASSIPKTILNEELEITTSLSYYRKLLSEAKLKDTIEGTEEIESLEKTVFELNEKFSILSEELKLKYPKYYNLKDFNKGGIDVVEIQNKLQKKDILLEYFVTQNAIYFIAISQDKATFHKTSKTDILKTINSFYDEISQKPSLEIDQVSYIEKGISIYKELIELAIYTHGPKQNIIVIPDNILNKIPFDCLYKKDSNGVSYPLVKDYNISYLYSIEQLKKTYSKSNNQKVLCLAPIFESSGDNQITNRTCENQRLQNLPYAQEELVFLQDNFEGKFLSGKNARSTDLLSNIQDHSIIHLATHGCLNSHNPMLSEIYFHDQALTNYELENLNVQPEMVVLSACNTANGSILKGEGVISLSRGFFEAGVKSLQSSLWSIDDYTSSEIMRSMYTNLKNGKSKSEALRLAKLNHLNSADKLRKHPYFWAAIIHIGNPDPIFHPLSKPLFSIIFSIGILAVLFLLFKKKSN